METDRAVGGMRVLMLTAHPGIAGPLPKLAPLMIDGMRRLGCEVSAEPWSRRREGESLFEKVVGRSQDLWRVWRHLGQRPCDVLFVTTTHDWPALLRDMPLIALTRHRCRARVLHLHGSMVDRLVGPGHRLMKACSAWLVRRCDAVLVLSREERDQWNAFCPEVPFEVVDNPFVPPPGASSTAPRRNPDPPALLFVGRLIPEKGILDLLEALRVMLPARPCLLRIAGSGSYAAAIQKRIAELGLGQWVELVGYVGADALAELYRSSDVLVLPTYFGEGFPTVITEAMSYGLPIVTTPIRGAIDHLVEGENVLFVPPRLPRALADTLLHLLDNVELRTGMGENNRQKVKQFAPERVLPRYVEIMTSLLTRDARKRERAV